MAGDDAPPAHARSVRDVLDAQGVDAGQGLSDEEVRRRRQEHGPNRLPQAEGPGVWQVAADQFKSVVVAILGVAAVLAFVAGQAAEGVAIVAVLVVNGLIGFVGQWRAVRSMQALREKGKPRARVRRDGREGQVRTTDLVPGDVVVLEAGDAVPADLRLIEANHFHADESSLTGESTPASKSTEPVDAEAPLAERSGMVYRGATVTEGSGEGVVVATGSRTEIGRVTELAEEVESGPSPLQERLNRFGARMGWLALALAGLVAAAGYASGRPILLMVETAVALGVAAVPEGVPVATTIALARGMWLLARRNALARRLTAVEALGATTVIFADKTGTLTENRMTLRRVVTPAGTHDLDEADEQGSETPEPGPIVRRILQIGALCNNATVDEEDQPSGDPMEVALLRAARRFGHDRDGLLDRWPEDREVAFDPDVMMMATVHEEEGGYRVAVKGAPKAVLGACDTIATEDGEGEEPLRDERRKEWAERVRGMAEEGLRLLAMAEKRVDDPDAEPYEGLRFLGVVGLADPPREGVREAIAACRGAGIRPIMVTGDRAETAVTVAEEVGLETGGDDGVMTGREIGRGDDLDEDVRRRALGASVFARLSPEQKYHLLRLYQEEGETAAMTGDGINDAPALRKADVGVAMGRRGTDAAREAADIILKDDAFATIVTAVREGRVIFANIRKALMFMLCTNLAEILAVGIASLAGAPLPLRPLQILYLNVLTDVFPALALGVGKGSPTVMDRPPRPKEESVLTRRHWLAIGAWSVVLAACVLGGLAWAVKGAGMETPRAVTVSFLTLGFAKLWFVFNLRDRGSRLWDNDVVRNPWIWAALAGCAALLVAAAKVPGLSFVLKTEGPGAAGWAIVLGLSLVPAAAGQVLRAVQRLRSRGSAVE